MITIETLTHSALSTLCQLGPNQFVSLLIFRYGKKTFLKTKLTSHIAFLRLCLQRKIVPKGMSLQHTPSNPNNTRLLHQTNRLLFQSSRSLIKIHLLDLNRQLFLIDKEILALKSQMSSLLNKNLCTLAKHAIHDLNRLLYLSFKQKKDSKIHRLQTPSSPNTIRPHPHPSTPQTLISPQFNTTSLPHNDDPSSTDPHTTPSNSLVKSIPPNLPLTDSERSVLSKGLNFVPLTPQVDQFQLHLDMERFFRSIRWSVVLGSIPEPYTNDELDPISKLFGKSKNNMPKTNISVAVEDYIAQCRFGIRNLKPKPIRNLNLTADEIGALKNLRTRDDIVIKPADKGGAVVVWSRQAYIQEALRQLDSQQHYTPNPGSRLSTDNTIIFKTIKQEIDSGNLPHSGHLLKVQTPRQPHFYMLPKIHKPSSPGRPIVSACSCPTEHISQFLDSILQPLVNSLPSYIKDSTHALQIIKGLNDSPNFQPSLLLTMDVTALYTNIPHKDGLTALRHYLDLRPSPSPPSDTLLRLAELVLNLNSFEFNGQFYQQVSGVAMGTKMGPSYACLFMGHLEQKMFSSYEGPAPQYFGRYIDDCLIISSLSRQQLMDFFEFANSFHPAIKFTFEISPSSISFLDILIQLSDGTLSTSVYYKPTTSFAYLDYRSSHPLSTRNSIPYSQFLRLRRLCSNDSDFEAQAKILLTKFINRHYPLPIVLSALTRAKRVPRETSLLKCPRSCDLRHRAIMTFHPHNLPVKSILLKKWHILQEDTEFGKIFSSPPAIAYRKARSTREQLTNSRLRPLNHTSSQPGTFECQKPNCGACPYIDKNTTILGPKSRFTVKRKFDCQRPNIVYVIRCLKCVEQKILYVGESGRTFETRIKEHVANIRHERDTPVSNHFRESNNHSLLDFRAQIIWQATDNTLDRRLTETRFIKQFGCRQPNGLNLRI